MRFICILATFLCIAAAAFAQPRISGSVKDSKSGEPIPAANVYFAQTTYGGTTDASGAFTFSGFPPGKYVLTISYVGYKPYQSVVEPGNTALNGIEIVLEEDITMLREIVVRPRTGHWERDFNDFRFYFLGESRFSQYVTIKNPNDLHLYFDTETLVLHAHSLKPIIIENSLTGYRIHYVIQRFEYHAKDQVLISHGIPRFEAMKPATIFERRKWEKNRADAFEGSFLHFARAWNNGTWPENGFTVAPLFRIPNPKRPSDAYLKQRIDSLRKTVPMYARAVQIGPGGISAGSDSLAYFLRLQQLPKVIDSVGAERFRGDEYNHADQRTMKRFTGMLHITHSRKEDRRFAALLGRPAHPQPLHAVVHLFNPVFVEENGYVGDINDLLLERYWAWSEKVSSMLPLDYIPPEK